MPRIVKNPDERRRELLVTAMRLFAEEGYDNVSVRAVARAAGVAPGLAYHYFDSKQNMFDAAIEEYSRRCAEGIIAILDDRGLSLDEKLDRAIEAGSDPGAFDHADFFHAEGNGALHDRLSLGMCEAVQPHLRAALELDALLRGGPPGRRGRARLPHGIRVHRARFGARHAGRGRRESRQALLRRPGRRVQVGREGRLDNRPNSSWGFS